MGEIIEGYAKSAAELLLQYDAIAPEILYAPVLAYFPTEMCKVLDVGAGTGRDAAWLAAQGHDVLAVEPVAAFRNGTNAFRWLDDRLPDLHKTRNLGEKFEFILVNAVLQHLRPEERGLALQNIAGLVATEGRVILSLRHGPAAPSRPSYPLDVGEILEICAASGLKVEFQFEAGSLGAKNKSANVHWTWLVLG